MKPKRIALITGGAKRIGKQIALHLAEHGFSIALHYHQSEAEALKTAEQIEAKGVDCRTFPCDLSKAKSAEALIPRINKSFGKIELLVNCASIFKKSSFKTENLDKLTSHMAINFTAPYILTKAFARQCKKGHVINILDTNVSKNKLTHFAYILSKKALYDFTKMAALDLAPGIRVNGIAPGLILPPKGKGADHVKRLSKNVPLKKKGSLSNIAQAVEFLINNDYMTGQILFQDGGERLT